MCRRILCAVPVITIVAAASLWLASPVWAQDFHDPVMDPDPVMDGVGMQTFFLNFGGFGFPLFLHPSWLTGQPPGDGGVGAGAPWLEAPIDSGGVDQRPPRMSSVGQSHAGTRASVASVES